MEAKDQHGPLMSCAVDGIITSTRIDGSKPELMKSSLRSEMVMSSQLKMETIAEELDFAFENRVYNDVPIISPIPDSGFESSTNYENVRADIQSSNNGYYENVLSMSNYENISESSKPYKNVVTGKPILQDLSTSDGSYQNIDFCQTKNAESLLYQVLISSYISLLKSALKARPFCKKTKNISQI